MSRRPSPSPAISTMSLRKTNLLFALAVLTASLGTGTAAADSLPDPRSPEIGPAQRLGILIERVKIEQAKIETLEADFVQTKESSMLLETSEARGVFYYAAPDRVRWEYFTPNPITLIIRGEEMTTWYRDMGRAERVHVGRKSEKILEYLGAGGSVDTLTEYFTVRLAFPNDPAEPYRLELVPRFERLARRLSRMTVWIDAQTFLPERVRYLEADGDLTDYRFENQAVNDRIPRDRFELELPREVDLRVVDLDRRPASR